MKREVEKMRSEEDRMGFTDNVRVGQSHDIGLASTSTVGLHVTNPRQHVTSQLEMMSFSD